MAENSPITGVGADLPPPWPRIETLKNPWGAVAEKREKTRTRSGSRAFRGLGRGCWLVTAKNSERGGGLGLHVTGRVVGFPGG